MSIIQKKVFIVLAAVIVFSASMAAGVFLSGNKMQILDSFGRGNTAELHTEEQTTAQPYVERIKTEKPEKIRGIWFSAGADYLTDPVISIEEAKKDIETKIADIKAMGFNTIFFDNQIAADSTILTADTDGVSVFSSCLAIARSFGIYTVASVPLSSFVNAEFGFKFDNLAVEKFVAAYDADMLLLTDINKIAEMAANLSTEERNMKITQSIQSFTDIALSSDKGLGIWTATSSDNPAYADLKELLVSTTKKCVYIESNISGENGTSKLATVLENVAKSVNETGVTFIAGIPAAVSAKKTIDKMDLMKRFSLAESHAGCSGTAIRSYSVLKSDTTGVAAVFLDYLKNLNKNDADKEFAVYNHQTTDITTNESKISFTGSSSPAIPLTCNDKKVETVRNGDFSVEFELQIGTNAFVFKQGDKSYKYNVSYKVDILKSVTPTGKVSAPGGTVVDISAVALRNAQVTAVINKNTVNLVQGNALEYENEERSADTSSDFVTFKGKFTLPQGQAGEQNLGTISVQAQLNGLKKTLNGAQVIVSAKPPETTIPPTTLPPTTLPETTSTDSSETSPTGETSTTIIPVQEQQLTPYRYAGVPGVSKMCEIATDYCKTMPNATLNNEPNPLNTTLLAGMFDYIDGESTYQDGNTVFQYYNLRSGKRVYTKDVKLIAGGYNLPSNKMRVISSSTAIATEINLSMLWKVPVNVLVKGQSYGQIHNSREFNVWSFTGNAIEFTFSYTNEASGGVNVAGSNTISSAEWSKDASGSAMILRLYFRRAKVFYGYTISYNNDGSLKISVKNKPSSTLSGYKIMLDPGHGGSDPGAICSSTSPAEMKYEKQINLSLALKTKQKLEAKGATVMMTRSGDSYLSADDRRRLIYRNNPDMYISIHCDSSESTSPMGTSAFYYYPYSYPLSDSIQKQIVNFYKTRIYSSSTPAVIAKIDRFSNYDTFIVTRAEVCPSILIEYGFVSNLNECIALQNNENQNKIAEATVQGIVDYIAGN